MSDKEIKNGDDPKGDDVEEKKVIEKVTQHVVKVVRDEKEKELQDAIDKEQKEKDDLNEEVRTLREQIQTLEGDKKTKTEEYDTLKTQHNEKEQKLVEIAQKEFEKRKDSYISQMEEAGLETEKIEEIKEQLKTPADLEQGEMYLTLIPNLLRKGMEEEEKKEEVKQEEKDLQKKKDEVSLELQKEGGGVIPLDQKSKEYVYDTYREGIDDLYARVAKGDKEAEKKLDGIWKLAVKQLKEAPTAFEVHQCQRCGGGIYAGSVCPYCGWDRERDWIVPAPER